MRFVRPPAPSRRAPAPATPRAPGPADVAASGRLGQAPRLLRTRVLPVAAVLALTVALPAGGVAGEGLAGLSLAAAENNGLRWALAESATGSMGALNQQVLKLVGSGADVAAGGTSSDDAVTLLADPGLKLKVTGAGGSASVSDIPEVAMQAYTRAERVLEMSDPECGLRWWMLAAIGRVESNHGQYQGVTLAEDGFGSRPIRGVELDGTGDVAKVVDTDGGDLDGDATFDRAMGPMQFIPATWEAVGVDADGDGERNADNIFDAAVGAGVYLCSGGGGLGDPAALREALHRYNPSDAYVDEVMYLAQAYESGDGMGGLDFGSPDGGYTYDGPGSYVSPYDDDYYDFDDDYYDDDLGFDYEVELPPFGGVPPGPANPAPPPALGSTPPPDTGPRPGSRPAAPAPPSSPPSTRPDAPITPTTTTTRPTTTTTRPTTTTTRPTTPTTPTTTPTDPTTPPTPPTTQPPPVCPTDPETGEPLPTGATTTTTSTTAPSTSTTSTSTTSTSTTTTTTTTTTAPPTSTTSTTAPTTTTTTQPDDPDDPDVPGCPPRDESPPEGQPATPPTTAELADARHLD
jgi:hypothetical protein